MGVFSSALKWKAHGRSMACYTPRATAGVRHVCSRIFSWRDVRMARKSIGAIVLKNGGTRDQGTFVETQSGSKKGVGTQGRATSKPLALQLTFIIFAKSATLVILGRMTKEKTEGAASNTHDHGCKTGRPRTPASTRRTQIHRLGGISGSQTFHADRPNAGNKCLWCLKHTLTSFFRSEPESKAGVADVRTWIHDV